MNIFSSNIMFLKPQMSKVFAREDKNNQNCKFVLHCSIRSVQTRDQR